MSENEEEEETEGNWFWYNFVERGLGWFAAAIRLGGGVARITPGFIRAPIHWGVVRLSETLNNRLWLDFIEYHMGTAGLMMIKSSDRPQDYDSLRLFFRLGLNVGGGPPFGKHLRYGDDSEDNTFFSNELAAGPRTSTDPPMKSRTNVRIAETCALLSILSYRDDDQIVRCMNETPPMLPDVSFLSVHTPQEGDLAIFIDKDEKWAVFCFRGTEYETLRDWFTSALLNPTTPFPGGSLVREDGTVPRVDEVGVRHRYFTQMLLACRDSRVEEQHMAAAPEYRRATTSAFALVEYLCRAGSETKIYFTGHSLGKSIDMFSLCPCTVQKAASHYM
mmetsp:Transcript_21159/g.43312  ORF Transcript_21159/g.43312 Transcript_21159/m.43312 type:complete len:333 (+) Transcript_21159:52-1050(+)